MGCPQTAFKARRGPPAPGSGRLPHGGAQRPMNRGRRQALETLRARIRACRRCPRVQGPPVLGEAVLSPVMLIGQAPGTREIAEGRPFAWTAGKTLFGWFARIGMEETDFRRRVYMSAVCRCFPGKRPGGGDRPPGREEIDNCWPWLQGELHLLQPGLVIPVGRLAIARFLPGRRLDEVVGRVHRVEFEGCTLDLAPLPHPSGASTWHRREPGRTLLEEALDRISRHPLWKNLLRQP